MRLLAAALISLLLTGPGLAVELKPVTEVDDSLRMQFFMMNPPETEGLLGDYTGRVELGAIDAKLAEVLPYGQTAVMFFAINGDLLAWSDKSGQVELGYWEVIDNGAFNEICLRFGSFGVASVCASPQIAMSDWLKELTEGNPFGLAAGEPVPAALGPEPLTLSGLAARLP